MNFSLMFLGMAAGVMLVASAANSAQIKKALVRHRRKTRIFPKAISMLVITAHLSEMLRVVEHISPAHIVAALLLLAIVAAANQEHKEEM